MEHTPQIVYVPVTKAGKGTSIPVDVAPEVMPAPMFDAAVSAGLKVLINAGATKITKEAYPDDEERFAAAKALAEKRVQEMYENKLKLGRATAAKGPSGAVMTEARRLARDLVKAALKAAGLKVSHYSASEITAAANEMIERDPDLIAQATANLENRGKIKASIDVTKMKEDPNKVAAAEKAAEDKKNAKIPLSAKQAGMVKTHVAPGARPH